MHCPRTLLMTLFAALSLFGAPFGCSTSTPTPDPLPQADAPEPAAQIYARYLPYMPADTAAVMILRTQFASEVIEDLFVSPGDEGGQAHLDAMREDFGSLLLKTLGVDPLSADSITMVASTSAQFLVLEGGIQTDFSPLATIESNGLSAHFLSTDSESSEGLDEGEEDERLGAWIAPLPDSEALAIFMDEESFRAAAFAYGNAAAGLEGTPAGEKFGELFSAPQISALTGAVFVSPALKRTFEAEYSFAPPDAIAFNVDRDLRVDFRGDETTLDGVKFFIEVFRKAYLEEVERYYQSFLESNPYEAMGYLVAYHLSVHFDDSIRISRSPESLVLEARLPFDGSTLTLLSGFAIPAIQEYMEEPLQIEATQPRVPGSTF